MLIEPPPLLMLTPPTDAAIRFRYYAAFFADEARFLSTADAASRH